MTAPLTRSDDEWTEYGRAGDPGPKEFFRPEDWISPDYRPPADDKARREEAA